MTDAQIYRLFEELRQKIAQVAARCTLTIDEEDQAADQVQVSVLDGEVLPAERVQGYGFQSRPLPGAEGLLAFLGGDRSHAAVFALGDRRYRVALEKGEVAMSDDLGQKVHLTRDGIVIDGGAKKLTLRSSIEIELDAPLVSTTGDLEAGGDVSDGSATTAKMQDLRDNHNAHTHTAVGVTSGPSSITTAAPNPPPM